MKRFGALVLCLPMLVAACSTMRAVPSPSTYLEQNNPRQVRVFATDGEFYVLRDPQLRGDTIRGFETLEKQELSLSIAGIQRMEAMQFNKTRTTLFIGALSVIGAAGIYMIANAERGGGLYCDNYDVRNRCVTTPPASVLFRWAR